jgi:nitrogen fixation/metabolism regulation signal transduction histidine kinase
MKIKSKLRVGLVFFFFIIVFVSISCAYFIQKLSYDSEQILKDNYRSIEYGKFMLNSIDDMKTSVYYFIIEKFESDSSQVNYFTQLYNDKKEEFDKYLILESNNITEIGELDYANDLKQNYKNFISTIEQLKQVINTHKKENNVALDKNNEIFFKHLLPIYQRCKSLIINIIDINSQAVERKNLEAKRDAKSMIVQMSIIASIALVVALFYIFFFPAYITTAISEINNAIKKISEGNYEKRIYFKGKDEFGELCDSFNNMADKLQKLEKE